ncbi:MAG: leucyl aminopeptidase [Oceanococcus sp.]
MKYQIKAGAPEKQRSACLVLGIFERRKLSAPAQLVDQACNGALQNILDSGDIDGKTGQTLLLQRLEGVAADRILLVGCGKSVAFNRATLVKVQGIASKAISKLAANDCFNTLSLLELSDGNVEDAIKQSVLSSDVALYNFDELLSKKEPASKLKTINLAVVARNKALDAALAQAQVTALGVALAKDLGNRPGNLCTPSDLADLAKEITKGERNMSCKVLEEKDMQKLGMGALLSVSRGSRQPAKLIVMEYNGGKKGEKPVALVGKGLTFDAGGISLKPAAKMEEMKFDMCGGATVFGVFRALKDSGLPINVLGIVPSSENMPDGDANKPGDVVTSMAGITIEVINTDAEGRLILCDALTYTQEHYDPELIIDMATLTGACVVALGTQATAVFANKQALADDLLAAGLRSGDRAWQLPLWEEYQAQLKSAVADVSNVGGPGAGAITAASFLHRFTRKATWAHLDIAGTAWGNDKLGTGRPVPLLMDYLYNRAK